MESENSTAERSGWNLSPENITEPFRKLYSLLNSMNLQDRLFVLPLPELLHAADWAVRAEAAILHVAKKNAENHIKIQLAAEKTAADNHGKTVAELFDEESRDSQ